MPKHARLLSLLASLSGKKTVRAQILSSFPSRGSKPRPEPLFGGETADGKTSFLYVANEVEFADRRQ
jgi:hypothetical protein